MGALTSLTKWIPEDDFILKEAVEGGASLESLAKGAADFSRRFTLRELQERWHSLLYDVDTSSEASARMLEIEIEYKANHTSDYKGKECSFGKRNVNSVRSHYCARRKRVCSKPCHSSALGFFASPTSRVDTGSDCCCEDQLNLQSEYPCSNFAVGEPISDHYGHLEPGYVNGQHALTEMARVDSAAAGGNIAHVHHTGHLGSVKDEHPDGLVGDGCIYGYAETFSPVSMDKTRGENTGQSFEHDYVVTDLPQISGGNLISLKASSGGQEIQQPPGFSTPNLYESENIEGKALCVFGSTEDNHESLHTGFVGNANLSLQAPGCSDSFHQLRYSSVQPDLPMWRTIGEISSPKMPMDEHLEDKDKGVLITDDIKKMDTAGCGGATLEPELNDGMCSTGLSNSTIMSGNVFVDFSSSYMDFGDDDELLYFDVDENDIADETCLLISSPSNTNQDKVPDSIDPRGTEVSESCHIIPAGASSGQSYSICDQTQSVHHKIPSICASETNAPSTSSNTSHAVERHGGFILCVLNTEDREVPCNDQVIPFPQVLSSFPSIDLEETSRKKSIHVSLSVKVLSSDPNAIVGDPTMVMEEHAEVAQSPSNAGPSVLPKIGLVHSSDGFRMEAESFENDSVHGVPRHADPHSRLSATVASRPPITTMKEDGTTSDSGKHVNFDTSIGSLLEKPVQGSDDVKLYSLNRADGCKQEAAMPDTMQKHVISHAELVSADMTPTDPVTNVSVSDQEENFSDNENEIPNFSDIESMILDMDLDPTDQESALFSKEASRYQHINSKKSILRLEQGAHSYMNRAISYNGAFAIFYGRRLKYFMKDPEVSLGRATEEVEVDIDLGREGRANKISRLQAIIKLDEDGTFVIRNIGKCSIFVNGKELPSKKRANLSSGSLIEIKDMRFIFEINEAAVRRYVNTPRESSSQEQSTRIDWIAGTKP